MSNVRNVYDLYEQQLQEQRNIRRNVYHYTGKQAYAQHGSVGLSQVIYALAKPRVTQRTEA
ncbi:hypothetical protein GCM10010969_39940 [Saccharibacillus kuerlensis]|uniref:Uncharacterized protein n=1 Tax=Saccharibacillus kuerlensis TaxID=459527 RepID=A0ABQ2LBK3_9BACL|nr:hypothetical protein GCM10010969_39940 [Saccharibacillus kuerlensis]